MSPSRPAREAWVARRAARRAAFRSALREWGRPVGSLVGLLLAYYAYPVQLGATPLALLSLFATGAGLALLGYMMIREVDAIRRGSSMMSASSLAILLMLVVIGFSLAFFILASEAQDQMIGAETRTDALYFTLSTMTTVGFGDVHASGQAARVMVIALMVFNVVVVAALLRAVTARRASELSPPPDSP